MTIVDSRHTSSNFIRQQTYKKQINSQLLIYIRYRYKQLQLTIYPVTISTVLFNFNRCQPQFPHFLSSNQVAYFLRLAQCSVGLFTMSQDLYDDATYYLTLSTLLSIGSDLEYDLKRKVFTDIELKQ